MIRRSTGHSGEERWILISQVEHARLSRMLAEMWGAPPYAPLTCSDEMLAAIEHHDDGWSAWEVAPKVDAQTGRPLDFTETPLTDSLAIWRDSIRAGAEFGPFAGYIVSGHFSALLERFSSRWNTNATLTELANAFLAEQRDTREKWLSIWQTKAGNAATRQLADRGVAWLQLFDWMSLWLCCAERRQLEQFVPPDGPTMTMRPVESPFDIEVSPWPYRMPVLEPEAIGRSIPARRYTNPSEVVDAPAVAVTLKWTLRKDGS